MNNHLFSAFQNKQFGYLWFAEIFTQIPINLLNFLLILVVYDLTKSNTAVAAIILSFTLPAVFFGVIAGIYIDRWNKQKVLLFTNIFRAILIVFLALFHSNVMIIFILSLLINILTQFFIPAESPIIPLIVKEKQLLHANAMFGIGIFGSILIAYLLSGPLLLYFGIRTTLLILAVMLIIAAGLIFMIKLPTTEMRKKFSFQLYIPRSTIILELKQMLRVIRSSRDITSSLFLLALSQILILLLAAIAPGFAHQVLHIRVEQFPLLVITPATVGIIMGAVLLTAIFHNVQKRRLVTIGILVSGLVMMTLPFCSRIASRNFVKVINEYLPHGLFISNIQIIVILAFILGIANSFVFISSNTLLQEKTDDTIRGKIYGSMNTLVGVFSFMPVLLVGSFSDLIGVSSVLVGIGVSLLIIACIRIFI